MLKYEIIDVFCVKYTCKPKNVVSFVPLTPYWASSWTPLRDFNFPVPSFVESKKSLNSTMDAGP